ncbi:hypothetical protein BJV74DRAFT_812002 [Russula compacta]|nr:hypothetical protein BJV74DRAFT_812002 [Russula compacta]
MNQARNFRVRFGGEDAEWINELDFISSDPRKRWVCKFVVWVCVRAFLTISSAVESSRQMEAWSIDGRATDDVFNSCGLRTNDESKDLVVQYHIYRRHLLFFCMSGHAFLEIKQEVTVGGLEKLIGTVLLHHVHTPCC